MTSVIKVFLKKCICDKNKKLLELLYENLELIIKNKYKLDFYALDKKKIKTLKNINPNVLPIIIVKNYKYEGLKEIRNFITSFKEQKKNNIIYKKNIPSHTNTKKSKRINFLFRDENENENEELSMGEKLNNEIRSRNININNQKSKGVQINNQKVNNIKKNYPKSNVIKKKNTSQSNLTKAMNKAPETKPYKKDNQDLMLDHLLENIQQTPIQYIEE